MIVLIMLFIILSISFGIKIKLKTTQEEAIVIAVFGMVIIAYILGIFNLLGLSIYAIGICSLISTIYTIIKLIKKEEKIKNLITLPTVIYTLTILFTYYIVKDIKLGFYDEYMFWGINLKEMVNKSYLWANSQMDGIHLVYQPFTAVAEYIFCKFNGAYNEGIAYLGIISLMITSMMPVLKKEKYNIKSFFKISITLIITYITIVLFKFDIANLSVDCILGVVFAVSMYLAYTIKEKKDYIVLTIFLIALTLIKANGILFAGIVIMQIFLKNIIEILKQKENIIKKLQSTGILLLIIIVSYSSWQIYCTLNGKQVDDRHDKNDVKNIEISEFINAILQNEKASERNKKIVTDFANSMLNTKIIRKYKCNTAIWIIAIVNILFILAIILSKNKRNLISNFLSINVGLALYILLNIIMYLFVFQKDQGEFLIDFARYMQTYTLAMVLNLIYIIAKDINLKTGIVLIVIAIIFQNGLNNLMIDPRKSLREGINTQIQKNAEEILKNVSEEEKMYIIDEKEDYGLEFMKTRYLISPRRTNLLYEWNLIKNKDDVYYKLEINEQELIEKLIKENYNYVYIISIDKQFLSDYKNIFSEEAIQELKQITVNDILEYRENSGKLFYINVENKKIETTYKNKFMR